MQRVYENYLDVFAKLFEDCLEWRLETEAFSRWLIPLTQVARVWKASNPKGYKQAVQERTKLAPVTRGLHHRRAIPPRAERPPRIKKDRALRSFVLDRLAEGWTPEQIAGWLKAGNERRLRAVGCETIYAFIYRAAQKAEQLWRYLTATSQTPPPAPIRLFARYHKGSRLHP